MTHIEGEFANSIYGTALLSWARRLNPPLPSLNSPATNDHVAIFYDPAFQAVFDANGRLRVRRDSLLKENLDSVNHDFLLTDHNNRSHDPHIGAEIERMQAVLSPGDDETQMHAVTRHLSGFL